MRILAILVIVAIFVIRLRELKTDRQTLPGKVLETRTLRIFIINGFVMAAATILESCLRQSEIRLPLLLVGVACAVASFAIRRSAIRALGKLWSLHVEIRESHVLVTSGPFLYVRHPTYLSQILELVSFCFLMNAFGSLSIMALVFASTMAVRIRLEERALREKLGPEYDSYAKQAPMLFPWKGRAIR